MRSMARMGQSPLVLVDERVALEVGRPEARETDACRRPTGRRCMPAGAVSGWCRSNAGRSERIRGMLLKLCRGGGQEVAHSSDAP